MHLGNGCCKVLITVLASGVMIFCTYIVMEASHTKRFAQALYSAPQHVRRPSVRIVPRSLPLESRVKVQGPLTPRPYVGVVAERRSLFQVRPTTALGSDNWAGVWESTSTLGALGLVGGLWWWLSLGWWRSARCRENGVHGEAVLLMVDEGTQMHPKRVGWTAPPETVPCMPCKQVNAVPHAADSQPPAAVKSPQPAGDAAKRHDATEMTRSIATQNPSLIDPEQPPQGTEPNTIIACKGDPKPSVADAPEAPPGLHTAKSPHHDDHQLPDNAGTRQLANANPTSKATDRDSEIDAAAEQRRPRKQAKKERREVAHATQQMVHLAKADLGKAYKLFEEAVAEGTSLPAAGLENLMFCLTGGEDWARLVRAGNHPDRTTPVQVRLEDVTDAPCTPVEPTAFECVQNIYEYLQSHNCRMKLASVMWARAKAMVGDVEGAKAVALLDGSQSEKLFVRHFTVALTAYAARRDYQNALNVLQVVEDKGLLISEAEYALLLESCVGSAPYEVVHDILMAMQSQIAFEGVLADNTIAQVRQFFAGQADCKVSTVAIEADGSFRSEYRQHKLRQLKVPPEVVEGIKERVRAIPSFKATYQSSFNRFTEWLTQQEPYDATIDGANVALVDQNWEQGCFQFSQIRAVYQKVKQMGCARPLIFLHRKRLQGLEKQEPWVREFVQDLKDAKELCIVNAGNDDWYWAYTAFHHNTYCVSNDNLRDLLWQLVDVPLLDRWIRQHRISYQFDEERRAELTLPPEYTVCPQPFEDCWMLPMADGQWLQVQWTSDDPVDELPIGVAEDIAHPVLAIDTGNVRVGLAATDVLGITVHPVATFSKKKEDVIARITEEVAERGIRQLVVGLPLLRSGKEGAQARRARAFAEQVQTALPGLPLTFIDERHTSADATAKLKAVGRKTREQCKDVLDQAAAMEIMYRYLQSKGHNPHAHSY